MSSETTTWDNVTISSNSGFSNLISAIGATAFHNVIIWNNTNGGVHNTAGLTITHSVIQGGCSTFTGSTKSCTTVSTSDPLLSPVQNNGGFAPTMSPGNGSAFNTGDDTVCAAAPVNGGSTSVGLFVRRGRIATRVPSSSSMRFLPVGSIQRRQKRGSK